MGDAKVTIALPRSMTQPEIAGDIETLTQRYWECMFSRMVMVGHAPQELVDFIGYNPVVELRDDISAEDLIADVLEHIDDYQPLVDRNRATAAVVYQPIYQPQAPIHQLQACNYQQIYSAHIVTAMGDCCYRGAKMMLQHRGNGVFSLR